MKKKKRKKIIVDKVFRWTRKQKVALKIFASAVMHIMLFGGSRSGKTFLICRNIALRAIKAPKSRHVILRLRFNDVKNAIALDTWPKMMELCFPNIDAHLSRSDWYVKFPNGSEVWFSGLDTKERTEKILGKEYVTLFLNEVSQIVYGTVEMAFTRLAQQVYQVYIKKNGKKVKKLLPIKAYYDCNPPPKTHWVYRVFVQKVDPLNKEPLTNPEDYDSLLMNPLDNKENLADGYIDNVLKRLSTAKRKRFLEGKFADAIPNALWTDESIEKDRKHAGSRLPDFKRVVVGVDPSGAGDEENADNDEIGIVVGALGADNHGYLLEDVTIKAGPKTWGNVVAQAYDRHMGDCVVGEVNYGGAMVEFVVKTAKPSIKYRPVHASRGKAVRAEPISALAEDGRIHHIGYFPELEEELCAFSTVGYLGGESPNRADAYIWVMTELFPEIAQTKKKAGVF